MIDIHCHILPGIDDGAQSLNEAREMLNFQQLSGVKCMYLTPHYYPEKKTQDEFLAEREEAWKVLSSDGELLSKFQFRLGAEIHYCREMLSLNLRKLTLGESNFLLLEFPHHYPAYAVQTMERLLNQGFIPILAHVERYTYFREDPKLLKRLVDIGALAQVSVQALFDRRDKHFAITCLRHNLAQIIATDAHNTTERRPCMELLQKLPENLKQLHDVFSTAVWENEQPPFVYATMANKTFCGYH